LPRKNARLTARSQIILSHQNRMNRSLDHGRNLHHKKIHS
jgi:hypothetical protein